MLTASLDDGPTGPDHTAGSQGDVPPRLHHRNDEREPEAAMVQVEDTGFWRTCFAIRPNLAAYLRAMLPDIHAVDDCLQETYLILAAKYQDTPVGEIRPLAFSCARNKALSWIKKQHAGRLSILDPELVFRIAEEASAAHQPETHSERVQALRECMGKLRTGDRELLESRYGYAAVSVAGVADGTGRSPAAAYKKLERLRALLRDCVKRQLTHRP